MALGLDDYREIPGGFDPHVREALAASVQEAARNMSPRGLKSYIDGAQALTDLGRKSVLVMSYAQQIPLVAKEVGDDVIQDLVAAATQLSSLVGGGVIAALFDSLPTAARRLGDAELLRQYLAFVNQLSAKAPLALRPMFQNLDALLGKLTLGGLRRWALWGAQVHVRDPVAMQRYFALESADSLAVLQRERRGTLFVDTQRRLRFYLRALWGRDFALRPSSGGCESREGHQPYIEFPVIHLPDAYEDIATSDPGIAGAGTIPGKELYRAAAAHAAAHLIYTRQAICAEQLNPEQMFLIGLFEDARIEALAVRDFPGLRSLWLQFHGTGSKPPSDAVVLLIERLATALLDPTLTTDDPLIDASAGEFRQAVAGRPLDSRISRDLGLMLHNRIGQSHTLPPVPVLKTIQIPYRDDNRMIWRFADEPWQDFERLVGAPKQIRRNVSLLEMTNALDCELAGDDAQEVWTLATPFYLDQEDCTINELEGKEPVRAPFHYPEWDYQAQCYRPNWVTILEKRQPAGDSLLIDQILDDYKPIARQLKDLIDALQPRGRIRQRRQADGEEIDLDAAVQAMTDIRMGRIPDPRTAIRYLRTSRDLAVLVLLDLSESTREIPPGADRSVLDLTREATALLAWSIAGLGDPFAIHGFASDGRHDVQYYRFKDFGQTYDAAAKARLAAMTCGLSTRMGAALRHAGGLLSQQPQRTKLLLLLTDGEPADIDERDPLHLRFDAKKAVDELEHRAIHTYCLSLDPAADDYVARVFGRNRYTVLDRMQLLPERLPALFLNLTR